MNPTFPPFSHREYCSLQGNFSSSFDTIEAGVKLIEDILQKKTLCYHDVTHINQAYQALEQLEKEVDTVPDQNSHTILLKLAQKIEKMRHNALAEELIAFYHLQRFPVSPINQVFKALFNPMNLTGEKMKEIATHLPFCKSQDAFEADVQALLGKNYSTDIAAILQIKRDQFSEHQKKEEKLTHLKRLREQDPSLYPLYLEEILHEGFFNLYDHLIAMKALNTKEKRSAAIKNLSFASFASIILEFRKTALAKVEKAITQENSDIIFLLGDTGSGKSTTLCYLRGDQMILQDNAYQSSTDEEHLIGSDGEMSCTLFPNISIRGDFILVDFPGFADTYGEVISLAIELTLKSLTKKYSPKILLLASITDTESRFEHVHLLGKRLERILGTLDNCLLGLTKYSKDVDFINIQAIEKKQREELSSPNKEMKNLEQQIQALEPFAHMVPAIQDQITQLKNQLLVIQELKFSSSDQMLPNTEEKSKYSEKLVQKEEAFKKNSGIKNLIPLKDLTDQKQLQLIIQRLSSQEKVMPTLVPNKLDAADEKLLEALFINDLSNVITAKKNHSAPPLDSFSMDISKDELSKKIKDFEQSILETSLINTLLVESYPEIGEFLHLESMDPAIVRKYDQEVITECIDGYINEVIEGLLVTEGLINKLQEHYTLRQSQDANHEWAALKSYILTLSKGIPPNADQSKIKEAWESLQKEHHQRLEGSKKALGLSKWMKIVLLAPLGIPYGIFSLFKQIAQDNAAQSLMESTAKKLYQSIKAAGEAVIHLKDIENTVKKKAQFDEIFSSHLLSSNSISSLQESFEKQINRVKAVYGEREWDERVTFLTNQLKRNFSSIRPRFPLGETLLYALISQEISEENLPPHFDKPLSLALIYSFITFQKNHQEVLSQLVPSWKILSYKDLKLSSSSYFFQTPSVTHQDYLNLVKQGQKLLEQSNKTLIIRLLVADAIYKLWKKLPLHYEIEGKQPIEDFTDSNQIKVLSAAKKSAWTNEYSRERLRGNKSFILSMIKIHNKALAFATDSLKNDQEVVLAAIEKNWRALQYASLELKNNREVVLAAIARNGQALQYASDRLKKDPGLILIAKEIRM
ncbi:MAG: DUF4116 domain-containing protein [Candidatus Rhabdochlamydia sp.]